MYTVVRTGKTTHGQVSHERVESSGISDPVIHLEIILAGDMRCQL